MFRYKPHLNEQGKTTVSCAILNNGEIYLDILSEENTEVPSERAFTKIEGELIDAAEDCQQSSDCLFMFTNLNPKEEEDKEDDGDKENEEDEESDDYGDEDDDDETGQYQISVLYKDKIKIIKGLGEIKTSNFNIITFKDLADYVVIQLKLT